MQKFFVNKDGGVYMERRTLITTLLDEQKHGIKGGIYNKLQVDFAYNSNHMEGSQLSHDQTRYIFETKTVGMEPARVDDIIETVNHFRCFDYMIQNFNESMNVEYIKKLHRMLKTGTLSSESEEAIVGDFKKYPNYVGDMQTSKPKEVATDMDKLFLWYYKIENPSLDDILEFHVRFEKIHPFYDGNGRTGRLIMFRECLKNDIVPFVITDTYKGNYYNGLQQWQMGGEKGFLRDTCLLMQDHMKANLDYFEISYKE